MNFGERIYELRSKNGMSQGELADKLQVSRQAVSKWENNSAVPELDKLLNMSELFGISLDELVKGEKIETNTESTAEKEAPAASVVVRQVMPTRKIAGLVLFGMAFLTALVLFVMGGLFGILYALPFLIFGFICFFCERNTGLKCLWAGNFMVTAFCGLAMGISASAVRYTFSYSGINGMGYRLIISWVLCLFNLFVIIFTALRLGKDVPESSVKAKKTLSASFVTLAAVISLIVIEGAVVSDILQKKLTDGEFNNVFSSVLGTVGVIEECLIEIAVAFLLTSAIRYIKLFRKAK